MITKIKNYLLTVGDALSQLINVSVFLSEDANESLSGRAYTQRHTKFWGVVYKTINLLYSVIGADNHCYQAYTKDLARASAYLRKHKNYK